MDFIKQLCYNTMIDFESRARSGFRMVALHLHKMQFLYKRRKRKNELQSGRFGEKHG